MNSRTILLLIVASVIALYTLFVSPLDEKRSLLADKIDASYMTLVKHERFIQRTQQAGIKLKDALGELEEMERFIIQESNTSIAFATLQSRVQDMADSSRLQITSIKPLKPIVHPGYTGLPILVEAAGNIGQLSQFLNYLDSTWEFISIDSISISTTHKSLLRIKIQLSGLMKK